MATLQGTLIYIADGGQIEIPLSNCTVTCDLLYQGPKLPVTISGAPVKTRVVCETDVNGAFSGTDYIEANANIFPPESQWRFTIQPLATCAPLVLGPITVADNGQPQGTAFMEGQPFQYWILYAFLLGNISFPVESGKLTLAFDPSQLVNVKSGDCYVNTRQHLMYLWNGVSWVPLQPGIGSITNRDIFIGYGSETYSPSNILNPVTYKCASYVNGYSAGQIVPQTQMAVGSSFQHKARGIITTPAAGGDGHGCLMVAGNNFCGVPTGGPNNIPLPGGMNTPQTTMYWEYDCTFTLTGASGQGQFTFDCAGRFLVYSFAAMETYIITLLNSGTTGLGQVSCSLNGTFDRAGVSLTIFQESLSVAYTGGNN